MVINHLRPSWDDPPSICLHLWGLVPCLSWGLVPCLSWGLVPCLSWDDPRNPPNKLPHLKAPVPDVRIKVLFESSFLGHRKRTESPKCSPKKVTNFESHLGKLKKNIGKPGDHFEGVAFFLRRFLTWDMLVFEGVAFFLGNWIAVFRGFKWMDICPGKLFSRWVFFLHSYNNLDLLSWRFVYGFDPMG